MRQHLQCQVPCDILLIEIISGSYMGTIVHFPVCVCVMYHVGSKGIEMNGI